DGEALIAAGETSCGLARLRQALADFQSQQAGLGWPWALSLIAEGYRRGGMIPEGLAVLDEAFAAMHRNGERQWEAELHRLQGELLCLDRSPDAGRARRCLEQAMTVAARQGARSLELRAALSLARMLQRSSEHPATLERLRDVYARFTEGF